MDKAIFQAVRFNYNYSIIYKLQNVNKNFINKLQIRDFFFNFKRILKKKIQLSL